MIIIYAILALLVNACCVKILHVLIQPEQLLGNWQSVLRKMSEVGHGKWTKPLGWCEICFAHFLTFISFWVFVGFMSLNGLWFHFDSWALTLINNIIFYLSYVMTGTILSTYFITRLFEK